MNSKKLYEGKAKILYKGPKANTLIVYFKDDATAFNNKKRSVIKEKGVLNNKMSELIMKKLAAGGVDNHFIKRISDREQLIKKVRIFPLEVIIRNIAAGSICKRLGLKQGMPLKKPLIEFFYKCDELDDPLITREHIEMFGWASEKDMKEITALTFKVNNIMSKLFRSINLKLVDFKIEFGKYQNGKKYTIILADEVSPDSCRLWDFKTNKSLDKDRFRKNLGKIKEAYEEVAERLGVV
ncbi:MAG: Phosphoribosylaminoimidazole-succinocarboxamide synthase [Alphaproteobacteria bacterium MarineAlpha6_Bin1]|nr:MAG: Phosphoribosylaminoimidazole-succinocarboxamide synthase [Alphaproteobacteria bacterium MarineAlpha6_Bin1]